MLRIKRVPTIVSNYQEEGSVVSTGCGRNCFRDCCLPGSKLPLYAFRKSDEKELPFAFLESLLLGDWEDRVERGMFRYDVTACETKVLEEKKWREVTNSFNFSASATNASFILRKYFVSLIYHFEQVYYFKAKAWTPLSNDTWQSTMYSLTSTSGMNKTQLPLPESQVSYAETQALSMKRQRTSIEDVSPKVLASIVIVQVY